MSEAADITVSTASAAVPSQAAEAGPSNTNNNSNTKNNGQQKNRQPNNRNRNGPLPRLTSEQLRHRLLYISEGATIILKMPSGRTKSAEILPGKQVSLGKFGSFKADDLIGMPYGFTYEIQSPAQGQTKGGAGGSNSGGGSTLKLVINSTLASMEEENDATNEHINDDGSAQKLTYVDIQELKNKGISGREIIEQQLAGSESFSNRTVYSQAKYVARKEQKHLKLFTPLQPDFGNICDFWFEKSPEKIRWFRKDALSQCLSFASVRPGGRYLVVDGVSGLLAGAVLERLGGDGTVIAINDAESPPAFDILPYFNLPPQLTKGVLKIMNWAATEPDYTPVFSSEQQQQVKRLDSSKNGEAASATKSTPSSSKDKSRDRKRQANIRHLGSVRQEYFDGDFDGILVACHYDSHSIITKVKDQLAGSASVVVHSPYLQPLVETHARLRSDEEFVNISVTEPWLRRYQVLPGRTHPEMTTSSTGGYILHALRVFTHERALELRDQYLASSKPELPAPQGDSADQTRKAGQDETFNTASADANTDTDTERVSKRAKVDESAADLEPAMDTST